jgi:hypothetical protein
MAEQVKHLIQTHKRPSRNKLLRILDKKASVDNPIHLIVEPRISGQQRNLQGFEISGRLPFPYLKFKPQQKEVSSFILKLLFLYKVNNHWVFLYLFRNCCFYLDLFSVH